MLQYTKRTQVIGFSFYSLAALAPIAWVAPLIIQYFAIGNYWDRVAYERASWPTGVQAGGYFAFVALLFVGIMVSKHNAIPHKLPNFVVFYYLYFIVSALSSIGSVDPFRSITYCLIGASMVWAAVKYWQVFPRLAVKIVKSIAPVVFVLIILMILYLGIEGRFIGGNLPNNIGKILYVLLCCGMLWRGSWKYIFVGSALFFTLLLSSRSSLTAMLTFGLVFLLVGLASRKLNSFKRTLIVIVLGIAIFAPTAALLFNTPVVRETLALDSRDRGIDSGFTGRTEYWNIGVKLISEKPIFGWGFRTRISGTDTIETRNFEIQSAHSGVLNLTIDTGLAGLLLISIGYLGGILFYIREYVKLNINNQNLHDRLQKDRSLFLRVAISFLIGFIPFWFIEPNYLNFGTADFPLTMLFIFSCVSASQSALMNIVPAVRPVPAWRVE